MRSVGNIIADSLQLGLGYAERLLVDIPPRQFAQFARPNGAPIESNHPAFVFGHLALYGPRIVGQLGLDPSNIQAPPSFEALFSKDASCQDDPEQTIYPDQEVIKKAFFDGYRAALAGLRNADELLLDQPNPLGGAMAERFPTLASMHAFYVGGHLMMHLGQLSAWRRMAGLGPA